jgi:hypothetical protein
MRRKIPEKPARRSSHICAIFCLDGPAEKNKCTTPRTKSARSLNTRKKWQHFERLRAAMARTGRYEEEAPHKAGVAENRFRVKRQIIRNTDARHHGCCQF